MDKKSLEWLAQCDESLANFETAVYEDNKQIGSYHVSQGSMSLIPFYADRLLHTSKHIDFIFTDTLLAFAIIRDKSSSLSLLVGPCLFGKLQTEIYKKIAKETGVGFADMDALNKTLKALSRTFPITFWDIGMSCYVAINHDLDEVAGWDTANQKIEKMLIDSYQQSIETSELGKMEGAAFSMEYEDKIIAYIKNGHRDKEFDDFPTFYHHRTILLNLDDARTYKDRCISMISICVRAAADAGLDPNSSCILNDMYIQKIEEAKTQNEMEMTVQTMVQDLTKRVGEAHLKHTENPTIDRAIKYVQEHIAEKITTNTAAKAMNIPADYLSSHFRKETKTRFMSFVAIAKTEEAKRLLAMTDKNLSEISNYLSFSSQSYFQNVFKNIVGMTPMEYRAKFKGTSGERK